MGNPARSRCPLRLCAGAAALGFTFCLSLQQEAAAAEQRTRRGATDRNNARLVTQSQPWRAQDQQPEEPPVITAQVSAFNESTADGERTRSLPFLFSYAPGHWYFEVSSDGITEVTSAEGRKRGMADIALLVTYTAKIVRDKSAKPGDSGESGKSAEYSIEPELEVDLPTYGEIGSNGPSLALRLNLRATYDKLTLKLTGAMAHDGGDATPGVSRDSRSLKAKVIYAWNDQVNTAVSGARKRRDGAPDKIIWGGELEATFTKKLTGVVSIDRTLSSGGNARSIQFDLVRTF
jgi:hypothetical protein